jgi:hypothetical protein
MIEFNGAIANLLHEGDIARRSVFSGGRRRTEYRHKDNIRLENDEVYEDTILEILDRHGGLLRRSELLRISHIPAKELDKRMEKFIADGRIIENVLSGRGRKSREYGLNVPKVAAQLEPDRIDKLIEDLKSVTTGEPRTAEEYDMWVERQKSPESEVTDKWVEKLRARLETKDA